jgi:hypothetical protein
MGYDRATHLEAEIILTPREQAAIHPTFDLETLHVITPIVNPKRYESRYRLYEDFAAYISRFRNIRLIPVEMAFGDRDQVIHHPNAVHVRSRHELWHKENLINLAAAQLPADWKYLAWVDADVAFSREDWAIETLHQLQHYDVVQMFAHAIDLGPEQQPFKTYEGFVYKAQRDGMQSTAKGYDGNGHPGYAWAMRRAAFDQMGGLIDTAIVGAGDHHMALALYGAAAASVPFPVSHPYSEPIMLWQERASRVIRGNVGYVPGTLMHYWHGKKADRKYGSRWSIIKDNGFDPRRDIVRDYQGLWQLSGENPGLRDALRRYFAARNEDSIDM